MPRLSHLLAVLAAIIASVLTLGGQALAISLEKPIDCQVGVNCFVQNYVDLAPGPAWADRTCGPLSYDKHKGTDIRVPFPMMQRGVAVLAAAQGVVLGVRDGMDDISIRRTGVEAVKNRECGNGVVIGHTNGMQTQYCHMKKGSIRVQKGQIVQTGQELGLVGLSGRTEFTHLHFEVRNKDGKAVCPFTGKVMESGCDGTPATPLWSEKAMAAMPYIAVGALASGFSTDQPEISQVFVEETKQEPLTTLSPRLLFWAGFWGVRKGDTVLFHITTPAGEVWQSEPQVQTQNQAQVIICFGKKRGDKPWPAGSYHGEATLMRQVPGGKPLVIPLSRRITIPTS